MIQEWLDNTDKDRVCVMMLWKEALRKEFTDPTRREINNLHEIMKNNITGWEFVGMQRVGVYGIQRCYDRIKKDEFITVDPEMLTIFDEN